MPALSFQLIPLSQSQLYPTWFVFQEEGPSTGSIQLQAACSPSPGWAFTAELKG